MMMVCLFCGRSPVQLHHVTGRLRADGPYLDETLVVPLCARHHLGLHHVWRILGLDTIDDPAEARRRRRAHFAVKRRRLGRELELPPGLELAMNTTLDPPETRAG